MFFRCRMALICSDSQLANQAQIGANLQQFANQLICNDLQLICVDLQLISSCFAADLQQQQQQQQRQPCWEPSAAVRRRSVEAVNALVAASSSTSSPSSSSSSPPSPPPPPPPPPPLSASAEASGGPSLLATRVLDCPHIIAVEPPFDVVPSRPVRALPPLALCCLTRRMPS